MKLSGMHIARNNNLRNLVEKQIESIAYIIHLAADYQMKLIYRLGQSV